MSKPHPDDELTALRALRVSERPSTRAKSGEESGEEEEEGEGDEGGLLADDDDDGNYNGYSSSEDRAEEKAAVHTVFSRGPSLDAYDLTDPFIDASGEGKEDSDASYVDEGDTDSDSSEERENTGMQCDSDEELCASDIEIALQGEEEMRKANQKNQRAESA